MRLADYFDAVAALRPDSLAFVDGTTRITYGEAQKYVHAVANGLTRARQAGVGTHAAIYAPNDYSVSLLHLGINLADFAWLSVHIRNSAETNAEVLEYFDTDIVFFHSYFESVDAGVESQALEGQTLRLHRPCIRTRAVHGRMAEGLLDAVPQRPGRPRHACLPATHRGHYRAIERCGAHASKSRIHGAWRWPTAFNITSDSRHLCVAPLTHAAGLACAWLHDQGRCQHPAARFRSRSAC